MRRMILTTLALLPVMAHAQANTETGPTPSTTSAVLVAFNDSPISAILTAAADTTPAAAAVPPGVKSSSSMTHVASLHEVVKTAVDPSFMESSLLQGGALQYTLRGSEAQYAAPKVVHSAELSFTDQELAVQPVQTNVAVRVTVDENGFPRNPVVVRSAGALVDGRAVQAVSQYRFQPATADNRPVNSLVTVSVKLQRQ
jgi:TonB family protein